MDIKAVLGSQYGDEGKGLTTDYLSSLNSSAIVVRHNGGAQAAHTVQTPDGRRHVFHHIGSGTFCGNATHLSRFMICNPIVFNREYDDLLKLGERPIVSVSPDAIVTLPADMLINQAVETLRGNSRHGSCGLGIGETVERTERGYQLTIRELHDVKNALFKEWFDLRISELNIQDNPIIMEFLHHDGVMNSFLHDIDLFLKRVVIREDTSLEGNDLIFEGAQGLLLDQTYGAFPYVTRSNTGIANVCEIIRDFDKVSLEAIYVSRSYQTRHGAGPMRHEGDISQYFNAVDPTNIPNQWQGTLRYGFLDIDEYQDAIKHDTQYASGIDLTIKGMLTCVDQMKTQQFPIFVDNELIFSNIQDSDILTDYQSYGPTRQTVR
jgi:adenylosuccinate synthase